jgi:hypothetical protein
MQWAGEPDCRLPGKYKYNVSLLQKYKVALPILVCAVGTFIVAVKLSVAATRDQREQLASAVADEFYTCVRDQNLDELLKLCGRPWLAVDEDAGIVVVRKEARLKGYINRRLPIWNQRTVRREDGGGQLGDYRAIRAKMVEGRDPKAIEKSYDLIFRSEDYFAKYSSDAQSPRRLKVLVRVHDGVAQVVGTEGE